MNLLMLIAYFIFLYCCWRLYVKNTAPKSALTWQAYKLSDTSTHPPQYGKYLICRKDGKIHWETWNGSGWAYNHNEIRYWAIINLPIK